MKVMSPTVRPMQEWDFGQARVALCEYGRGHEMVRETCPDLQYWLVLRGEWTQVAARAARRLGPADTTLERPGWGNRKVVEQPLRAISVQLRHRMGEDLTWADERRLWEIARMASLGKPPLTRMQELCRELGADDLIPARDVPEWLAQARALLRDAPPGLTLETLANEVGISPQHLSARFRLAYGETISAFLRHQKVRLGVASLAEGKEAWVEAGFYDPSHFRRTLRQDLGMSQSEIRPLVRAKP